MAVKYTLLKLAPVNVVPKLEASEVFAKPDHNFTLEGFKLLKIKD